MTVTATTTRFSFAGNGNQGPHTIGFIILDATHIQVYFDKATSGAGTPITGGGYTAGTSDYLVKDVHYTVQNAGTSSNATITYIETGFTVDSTVTYPTSSDSIIVTRNVPLTQTSDYTNNSTIDAETLENSYDKLTQITQQLDDNKDYSFKFATSLAGTTAFDTTVATASTLNVNKADRLNKAIKFNASGNIGVSTYDPDEQVANATTQATNAAASATLAGNYATKIDGVVTGSDYSSKAWAVGGTGVTDTASAGAAKEWATAAEDDLVDTSEYSAKHYSIKASASATAAAGSATSAANSASVAQATSIAMAIALG
jgi:hypothetical protein